LQQRYGITDPATLDKIIAEITHPDMPLLPAGFRITAADKKRHYHRLLVPIDVDMWISHDYLGLDPRVRIGATGTPTYSKELADTLEKLQKVLKGQLFTPKESDLEKLRSILAKVEKLTPEEVALFKKLALATDDLAKFERSVDAFLAAGGRRPPAASVAPPDPKLLPLLRELEGLIGVGAGLDVKDQSQLERILGLARQLTEDQRGAFKTLASPTMDADALEATLSALAATPKAAGEAKEPGQGGKGGAGTKADAGAEAELQGELEATWSGVTEKQFQALDRSGRVALAREIANKQTYAQLKHMVKHPGQVLKGMVTAPFKGDEVARNVGRDIDDVIHGKSGWQRAAGAVGAAKEVSGWLAAMLALFTVLTFIIAPELALQTMMMHALALAMASAALSLVESELRIQQAGSAPSFELFKVAVEQAATAQAQFVTTIAMMAVPIVGEVMGKIPVVGRVMGVFRGAMRLGGERILAVRSRVITTLKEIKTWAWDAVKNEGAQLTSQGAKIRGMTQDQFLRALTDDPALRESLGFDEAAAKQIRDLLETPAGKQVLSKLQAEIAQTLEESANLARASYDEYLTNLQSAIDELEAAQTPGQAEAAVEHAEKVLGEKPTAEKIQEHVEEYVEQRQTTESVRAQAEADAAAATEEARRAPSAQTDQPAVKKADEPPKAGKKGTGLKAAQQRITKLLKTMMENDIDPQRDLGYNAREWEEFKSNYEEQPESALADLQGRLDRHAARAGKVTEQSTDVKPGGKAEKAVKPKDKTPAEPPPAAKPDYIGLYEAAQERARIARNEVTAYTNALESWSRLTGGDRPEGWLQELEGRKEALEGAKIKQGHEEMEAQRAEKALRESTLPLHEKLGAAARSRPEVIRVRDLAKGIDRISGRKSSNLAVDHLVSIKRITMKRGFADLSWDKQLEIVNMRRNLVPMDGPANSSKGEVSWEEWSQRAREWGYGPIDIRNMIDLEKIVEKAIDDAIVAASQ
jgi:hypothetical protein